MCGHTGSQRQSPHAPCSRAGEAAVRGQRAAYLPSAQGTAGEEAALLGRGRLQEGAGGPLPDTGEGTGSRGQCPPAAGRPAPGRGHSLTLLFSRELGMGQHFLLFRDGCPRGRGLRCRGRGVSVLEPRWACLPPSSPSEERGRVGG